MKYKKYLLTAVLSLTAGLASGGAWPPPPLPKMATAADIWSLPAPATLSRHQPKDMAAVTSAMQWNGRVGELSMERQPWRLAGILADGDRTILVTPPDNPQKPQRISVGGLLPDGSQLTSVVGDRITTQLENCTLTYQLFHTQPVEKSGSCTTREADDQGKS